MEKSLKSMISSTDNMKEFQYICQALEKFPPVREKYLNGIIKREQTLSLKKVFTGPAIFELSNRSCTSVTTLFEFFIQ